MASKKRSDSLIWGIILIALGFIFLLETFDVEIWHYVWRLWPLILIVWGADKLYNGIKERQKKEEKPEQPATRDKSDEV